MRAISVRQPWANLIASGRKTIETRTWSTRYRGEILVVSSARPAIEPAGCALAIARLVDCRPMTAADESDACCPLYPRAWSWVLHTVRLIVPFPVIGRRGLYEIDSAKVKILVGEPTLISDPQIRFVFHAINPSA